MESSALANAESWLYWIGIAKLFAAFFVAAGVAIEFGGDWVARPYEKIVTDAREAEVSKLNTDLGTARAAIAKSDEETAKANKAAAQANERAVALEKDAANARLEQERLKAQMAWRTIDQATLDKLKAALAQHPGKVNIKHPSGDTESEYLAVQLANAFSAAKWQVAMFSAQMGGMVAWGLFVPETAAAPGATQSIRDALKEAGIGFSTQDLPQLGTGFGSLIPDGAIVLVGSKPPPQQQ